MQPPFFRLFAAAASAAFLSAAAGAADLPKADAEFINKAAQSGHYEVEVSKLAQTKGTATELKTFAQQMVSDHTKSGEELNALAQSKGVQPPAEPSGKQKAQLRKLGDAQAGSFDKAYAKDSVEAHEDTVQLFRKAARDAKDNDVKTFASRTLPTLEHHLKMAQDMKSAVDTKR